jgi:hypothetical protein
MHYASLNDGVVSVLLACGQSLLEMDLVMSMNDLIVLYVSSS